MAAHSSVLAWKIPWTAEPGSYCPWGRKESDTTERFHFIVSKCIKPSKQTHLNGHTCICIGTLFFCPNESFMSFLQVVKIATDPIYV